MITSTDMSTGTTAPTRYAAVCSRVHVATVSLRTTGGVRLEAFRPRVDRFLAGGIALTPVPSGPPTD